jgi:hypothetical protein
MDRSKENIVLQSWTGMEQLKREIIGSTTILPSMIVPAIKAPPKIKRQQYQENVTDTTTNHAMVSITPPWIYDNKNTRMDIMAETIVTCEIGTSIHLIMQSVGTMTEQVTEVSIAASPQTENINEPQLRVPLIVTPPHNLDVMRETKTMYDPTTNLQMNSSTLNEFASMLRKF